MSNLSNPVSSDVRPRLWVETLWLLTRAIGSPDVFGKNTSLQRAIGLVATAPATHASLAAGEAPAWTSESIEARQATMAKLAREVWMVDHLCGQAKG